MTHHIRLSFSCSVLRSPLYAVQSNRFPPWKDETEHENFSRQFSMNSSASLSLPANEIESDLSKKELSSWLFWPTFGLKRWANLRSA